MYIIRNALKCISRSKARNILIGIIVLVISVSACIGLSIRQAAESAKKETLDSLSVTAVISFDRQSMMKEMRQETENGDSTAGRGFDRSAFSTMMGESTSLSLEEYENYAQAESVDDFYYSISASFNGTDTLAPITNSADVSSSETVEQMPSDNGGGYGMNPMKNGGMDFKSKSFGDFSIVGYSSENAMTDFVDGTISITDGTVFEEGTSDYQCIISEELAQYNDLAVGDSLEIANPNSEEETYSLTVTGIYSDSSANESSFGGMMGMTASDPANKIYMSSTALQSILDASASASTTVTDSDTGLEYETAVTGTLSATYVLADADAYERFETEVRELGLDESYTVSSPDLTAYENSLTPLNTLSTMAGYFLIVILAIGAIILIVLNIFNVRERKYEIGVLTAMGMKNGKVALQFLTEIFIVTITAVVIGIGFGAVSAVPVTNALLENQISSQQSQTAQIEANFGRGGMNDKPSFDANSKAQMQMPGFSGGNSVSDYVSEVNSAMNFTVVLEMFGIAILLTLASGIVSMLFVMRYEPLKILANRD